MGEKTLLASDGLVAREAGDYARRKLSFIDFYAPLAIDATEKKHRRRYLDLFAGPGMNLIRETSEEVESGALRVLASRGRKHPERSFDEAFLVNLDPADHAALKSRVETAVARKRCWVPPSCIHHELGDANELLPRLLARCHQLDYILVFADIEAPRQLPWQTVEKLTASGHGSVDLYVLFPLGMGLNRLMPYGEMPPGHEAIITAFFGTDEWRPILADRVTKARSPECQRRLEDLYLRRLGTRWRCAFKLFDVMQVGQRGLYRMLFATSHPAGEKIASWASAQVQGLDQTELFKNG